MSSSMYEIFGFLLIGIIFGMSLLAFIIKIANKELMVSYVHNITGNVWYQTNVGKSTDGTTYYVLLSSKDCETLVLTKNELDNSFKKG